jgi:hypothetical protein
VKLNPNLKNVAAVLRHWFDGGLLKPEAESLSACAIAAFAVVAIAILWLGFWQNQACLMHGLDGVWYRTMFDYEALDRPLFSQTGVDALSGNFDAWYPLSPEYLLPHALALPFSAVPPGKPFIFVVFSIFLAVAIYAVARSVGASRAAALTGGFLMPLLAGAGVGGSKAQFFSLFENNPYWFQATGLGCLIVAAFWRLQAPLGRRAVLLAMAPTLCVLLAVVSEAPHVLFMVPVVAIYSAGSLLASRGLIDAALRISAALVTIIVLAALGVFTYYYGIIAYSAFRFFPNEIEHPLGGWMAFSTISWTRLAAAVIVLGIAGAIGTAVAGSGRLRLFAITHLIASAIYFPAAYWFAFRAVDYRGSWPIYFETGMWPYALIFCAIALAAMLRLVLSMFGASIDLAPLWWRRHLEAVAKRIAPARAISPADVMSQAARWLRPRSPALVLLGVAAAAGWINLNVLRHGNFSECAINPWLSIRSTPITQLLEQQVSLRAGEPFRGMVATVDAAPPGGHGDWLDFHDFDETLLADTGNDYRTAGLWRFNIPTLFQYHTFITPPYYVTVTDFLSTAADHQLRSSLVMTRINPVMMALWGVRYIITDRQTTAGREVATLQTRRSGTLHVVELPNPNLGNYSPVQEVRGSDFADAIQAMHRADFDGSRIVVTMDRPIDRPLVPARQAELVYTEAGFHLTATSDGDSVLVLPAQYSHCWTVAGIGNPVLFRADAMQLGVKFSGKLDARLIFRLGPILAGRCRVDDLHDVERLRIDRARSSSR